uniref:Uncharacterized protein n=1 Tax=Tanacetum cinerariifolium TaxID=118510 RepID=A0A6L2LII2_TANCI|nr:hypothetical protein [Tanacetum cinerariifolium]
MNSTQASSFNPFKKIKLTIIPPRQLFVNISSDEDVTTTPSPTTTSSSPTPPNAQSKTPSTNQTSSSQESTSSSFQSKLQISPPSSNEPTSPQPLNPLLDNISDVPPRTLNPQPLQVSTKGSVSSHTHGWESSSSSMLDFAFFDLDFRCPPMLSSLSENASRLFECANTLFPLPPSLLKTPPSLLLSGRCLGDSDRSRLILEKTLGFRSGLPDMLWERLDLSFLLRSLASSVLDSEYCNTSWIFEFFPELPSKLRRAFYSFNFSCCFFSW